MMEYEREYGPRPIARLLFSPIRGAEMAARYHAFTAFAGYPLYRFLIFVVAQRVRLNHQLHNFDSSPILQ